MARRRTTKRVRKREAIERELVDRLCAELKLTPPSTVRTAADAIRIILLGAKRGE